MPKNRIRATIKVGDTVQVASVDQSRDSLDDSKTVWEEISGGQDLIKVGKYETLISRLRRPVQLSRQRTTEEDRTAVRR